MKTYYEPGKILLWKKKVIVIIYEAVFLKDQPENFLHYHIKKEGKEGLYAAYPDDLEEIK